MEKPSFRDCKVFFNYFTVQLNAQLCSTCMSTYEYSSSVLYFGPAFLQENAIHLFYLPPPPAKREHYAEYLRQLQQFTASSAVPILFTHATFPCCEVC